MSSKTFVKIPVEFKFSSEEDENSGVKNPCIEKGTFDVNTIVGITSDNGSSILRLENEAFASPLPSNKIEDVLRKLGHLIVEVEYDPSSEVKNFIDEL